MSVTEGDYIDCLLIPPVALLHSGSFQLKLHFALSNRVEVSTETIIKEVRFSSSISAHLLIRLKIQNGPYELIKDPDMKAIWKGTLQGPVRNFSLRVVLQKP